MLGWSDLDAKDDALPGIFWNGNSDQLPEPNSKFWTNSGLKTSDLFGSGERSNPLYKLNSNYVLNYGFNYLDPITSSLSEKMLATIHGLEAPFVVIK